jgi:hypothetical protein
MIAAVCAAKPSASETVAVRSAARRLLTKASTEWIAATA